KQEVSEQESGEVIHGKAQFVSFGAGATLGSSVLRTNSGVADEDIEPLVVRSHHAGELAATCKRRQIGLIEDRRLVPCPLDILGKRFCPRRVAAVDQHL